MTLSEFRQKYPNGKIGTVFHAYCETTSIYIVQALIGKNEIDESSGLGMSKTVEEAEDNAITRALEHLGN